MMTLQKLLLFFFFGENDLMKVTKTETTNNDHLNKNNSCKHTKKNYKEIFKMETINNEKSIK